MVTSILGAQSFDGIELCSAHGGKDAEKEANGGRQAEGKKDGDEGRFHRERKDRLDQENDDVGANEADDAAGGGQDGGLRQELQEDVLLARPERATQTDFASALGDAGEHDVHDHDAADNEKDADEGHGDEGEIAGELMPELHDGVGAEDGEIVGGIVLEMAPGAHEHAGFVFAGFHKLGAGSLHKDGDPIVVGVPTFAPSAEGHQHVVVLRLAEGAAQRLGHADDFIGVGLHTNGLANRIDIGEELFDEVRTDEDDFGAVVFVRKSNETALRDAQIADVGKVGGRAHHHDVFHDLVAAFDGKVVVLFRSDGGSEFHVVAEALKFLEGQERALLGFNPLVLTGDNAETVDDEDIGAEIGDAVGDIEVEAGDDAHDHDQGGDGKNDAQEGEEAAEFVSAESVEGELKGFAKRDPSVLVALAAGGDGRGTRQGRRGAQVVNRH